MQVNSTQASSNIGIQNSTPATSSSSSSSGSVDTGMNGIGETDFMKLLVAQIRNQDPMQPMDNTQFISQMAELNTVQQITAMNNQVTELLNSEAISQASALIGKNVEATQSDGSTVTGVVQQVQVAQGKPTLVVNGKNVNLGDITQISSGN